MKLNKIGLLIAFFLFIFPLMGCGGGATPPATDNAPEKIYTAAAMTVQVQLTKNAALWTPTMPPIPTLAPIPQATIQPVVIMPTNTQAIARCDAAEFIGDVTIPDNTGVQPNATFTKTWRLKNIGTCAWTTQYAVVFAQDEVMNGASPQNFTKVIQPGEMVDVSINMIAPATAGVHKGQWKLRNAQGAFFGIGAGSAYYFYVQIVVLGTAVPTTTATATATFTPTITLTVPVVVPTTAVPVVATTVAAPVATCDSSAPDCTPTP